MIVVAPFLAACQRGDALANNQQSADAPAPRAAQPESDVARSEWAVRTAIGNAEGVTFVPPQRTVHEGVPIQCGEYRQGAARQRYIVVNGEQAFIEPRMGAGEMDRAFVEFCGGERG